MNDRLTCEHVRDLAAGFVLDALGPTEMDAVRAHLATCAQPHPELAELGGVVPYLAELPEPLEPPAALKGRLMAAIEAEVAAARTAAAPTVPQRPAPISIDVERARRRPLFTPRLALQLAAVLLIAVLGGWDLLLLGQTQAAQQEAQLLRDAIGAAGAPGAHVGGVAGTKEQPGASGFVAIAASRGTGYLVVEGLAPAPTGKVYQAWYIAGGVPRSAGLMATSDGLAVLALSGADPVETVALTIEPAGGSVQPTLPIIAAGQPGA
ncbi:MAG: anti-sigma factor domain-containing protein [Candidatus Limnocylindrales bacterium]